MKEDPTQQSRVCVELGMETRPVLIRFSSGWMPGGSITADSYALRTTAGWVLIDPWEPTPEGTARLRQLIHERPVATVLTSDRHERSCYEARRQWGIPVWGPTPAPEQGPHAVTSYGVYRSVLAVAPPWQQAVYPPITSTCPVDRSSEVWPLRAVLMFGAADHVFEVGS